LLLTVDFLECGGGDGENCVLVKVIEIIDLLAVDEYRIFIFLDGRKDELLITFYTNCLLIWDNAVFPSISLIFFDTFITSNSTVGAAIFTPIRPTVVIALLVAKDTDTRTTLDTSKSAAASAQ
jgi:hypothetical protein